MSTFRAVVMTGLRAVALIGILPGAIVAAAYLLVLTEQLYRHWDVRTAIVVGMAVWGVLGVFELWRVYLRLSRNRTGPERTPVSPRALLFVWALILLPIAGWKFDERPWTAAFLALVALYSLARAFGLLSDEQRQAMTLRVIEGLPYGEVARLLECTEDAARARVSRGLRRLTKLIGPQAPMLDLIEVEAGGSAP